ncbi:MAG: GerAB/ArcD/ProY family transporter [Clostridia bacterium]|nr:GerAB/ArcD/ProY family transporter [Clostridia bacterium]
MSSRSAFSLWLGIIFAFLPSLSVELSSPFHSAYGFLSALPVGVILYGLLRFLINPLKANKLYHSKWISFLFVLLFSFLSALFIENFGTRIVHSLMLHSDARFYNMTLLILATVFSWLGLKPLGRMSEILCPFFAVLLLLIAVPILMTATPAELFPLPKEAFLQILPQSLSSSVLLGAGSVIFLSANDIPCNKKQCLYTAFFATVYTLLFPLLTTLLSGRYLSIEASPTIFSGLRQSKLFGVIGNPHILIILPWMMISLVACSCFLTGISVLLKRTIPRFSESFCKILSPLSVLVILALRNEWNNHPSMSLWIGVIPAGALLFYGLPILVMLLDRRKTRPPSEDC